MEELRSTEALDREILEDARKKAFRILKTADESLGNQARDWEQKTEKMIDSVRKSYAEKTKKDGEEIFARLPLDKRRLRTEYAEKNLLSAMNEFLRSLPAETRLAVMERELKLRLDVCREEAAPGAASIVVPGADAAGAPAFGASAATSGSAGAPGAAPAAAGILRGADIVYSGLKLQEAKELLKKAGFAGDYKYSEDPQEREFPSLVINTESVKISVSIEAAAAALLSEKRAELAAALLGEGVLND